MSVPMFNGDFAFNQPTAEYADEDKEEEAGPLVPRLSLFGQSLQPQGYNGGAMFREAIAFPETLDVFRNLKLLNISSTPQTGPRLSGAAFNYLGEKWGRNFAYYHLGHGYIFKIPEQLGASVVASTGFYVHFYFVLPFAHGAASPNQNNTGGLTNENLELLYDKCILPALERGNPLSDQRGDWAIEMHEEDGDVSPEKLPRSRRATWAESKAEFTAYKRKNRSAKQEPGDTRDEYVQASALQRVWELIFNCQDEEVKSLCEDMELVLHCKPIATEPERCRPWQNFQEVWEGSIRIDRFKPGTRFTMDMHLGM